MSDLFCIITKTPEEAFDAMMEMSIYDPLFTILINHDDDPKSVVLVVHENDCMECGTGVGNFRLSELCCQMNYRQTGSMVCPVCEKKGLDVCGHLTFVNY